MAHIESPHESEAFNLFIWRGVFGSKQWKGILTRQSKNKAVSRAELGG